MRQRWSVWLRRDGRHERAGSFCAVDFALTRCDAIAHGDPDTHIPEGKALGTVLAVSPFSVEVRIDRYPYYFIFFFHEYGSPFAWCGNVPDRVVFAIFSPFELP